MDAKMIEMLGLSQEELQTRVVERIADDLLYSKSTDEDGQDHAFTSKIVNELRKLIEKTVGERVEAYGKEHVEPAVIKFIEDMTIQPTNSYGEKKAPAMTFKEFMVKKAEEFVNEKVDFQGKAKGSSDYGWSGTQTRLASMMHHHLHYNIENAVKQAINSVNESVGQAIADTAKMKLDEIVKKLHIAVTTR